jgi:putative membrane protein
MAFVDPLALQLFTLAFVAGLLFYSGVVGYVTYRRHGHRPTYEHLRAQIVPLAGVGVIVFAIGIWGEVTWPLPGSYNILFYDPYSLLGVILVGFAVSIALRVRTQYIGLLAAMTGALSIYYGISAYQLGMTKDPLTMLFLYIALGGTAVLTFPVTIYIDRMVMNPVLEDAPNDVKKPITLPWKLAYSGFLLFLLFAVGSAILALIIGGGALSSHLASAP